MAYMDNAGLYRKYGTEKTVANTSGEYFTDGNLRQIEVKITAANLTATETILSDVQFLPAGAIIQEVEVITQAALATGTAIDLGLIRTDRTTETDYDGLLAAFPTSQGNTIGERTIFTSVTTVPASQTGTGALIGTALTNVGYISASRTDATAFTAGVLLVQIRYYMP